MPVTAVAPRADRGAVVSHHVYPRSQPLRHGARVPITPPRRLGPWRVLQFLGEGTFSTVWSAAPADTPLHSPADYAIKVVRETLADDPRVVNMLRREAEIGRAVSHPHLVPILDYAIGSEASGYLVMPRLRGALASVSLVDDLPFAIPHALWIARQVAEALDTLHANGWVHGDVKPENIHVDTTGHATLIDLGLARMKTEPGDLAQRERGGSLDYAAPETLVPRAVVDGRADIYSLGVTLYQLLTGRPPFLSHSASELVRCHRARRPTPAATLRPDLKEEISDLVQAMLAKEPCRRPFPLSDLCRTLMRFEIMTLDHRAVCRRERLEQPSGPVTRRHPLPVGTPFAADTGPIPQPHMPVPR